MHHGFQRLGRAVRAQFLSKAQYRGNHHHRPDDAHRRPRFVVRLGHAHIGQPREASQCGEQQIEGIAIGQPQVGIPGKWLFMVDLVGAMAFARRLRLGFRQAAPAAGQQREQGIKPHARPLQHVAVGAARSLGRRRHGAALATLFKNGSAPEMPACAPPARGGRKKRFQEGKHRSAPVLV
ncbi:hypothetical protein D3C73_1090300 [compost metagenome]